MTEPTPTPTDWKQRLIDFLAERDQQHINEAAAIVTIEMYQKEAFSSRTLSNGQNEECFNLLNWSPEQIAAHDSSSSVYLLHQREVDAAMMALTTTESVGNTTESLVKHLDDVKSTIALLRSHVSMYDAKGYCSAAMARTQLGLARAEIRFWRDSYNARYC